MRDIVSWPRGCSTTAMTLPLAFGPRGCALGILGLDAYLQHEPDNDLRTHHAWIRSELR